MSDSTSTAYGIAVLRVTLGVAFIAHALLKLFVFTLPGTAQFFGSIGLPPFLGYVVFVAELVGGAMLLAGIATRYLAAALVPIMLGAKWAHAGNGWLFTANGGGWEYPAFWTAATVAQVLLGDGAFALGDKLLGRNGAPRLQSA
jgi:putative oxidoreductase